jgi:(p)ppGpp synthase/HD superfamily hydrolase
MNYNQTYLTKEDLQNMIEDKVTPLQLNQVISAYEFSDNAFGDQKLPDGTPHFFHCTRVCQILIEETKIYDPDILTAALLHRVYSADDEISTEIIDLNFGPYVAFLLEALIDEYRFIENDPLKFDDHDKFRIPADDYLIIWLADHLDTFRCLDYGVNQNPMKYIKETERLFFDAAEENENESIKYLIKELKKERNKLLG